MATNVKFTVTHHRRPEHTHEAFMKWIVEEHIPLAIPVFKRHGFATPADLNAKLKATFGGHRATWDYADFDCFIEYTLEKVENIDGILGDWAKSIANQDDWVDTDGRPLEPLVTNHLGFQMLTLSL
ncbi:hypothetical protein GGS24DRAFT_501320 [Hypoxylon argillaceum]|nr:hypothetical protein GGS24DRAFT_501320 [Hypoxylon argillaceum]